MPLTAAQKRRLFADRKRGVKLAVLAKRAGTTAARLSYLLRGKCRDCGRLGNPFSDRCPACRAAYSRLLAQLSPYAGREPAEYTALKAARVEQYRRRAELGLPLFDPPVFGAAVAPGEGTTAGSGPGACAVAATVCTGGDTDRTGPPSRPAGVRGAGGG